MTRAIETEMFVRDKEPRGCLGAVMVIAACFRCFVGGRAGGGVVMPVYVGASTG